MKIQLQKLKTQSKWLESWWSYHQPSELDDHADVGDDSHYDAYDDDHDDDLRGRDVGCELLKGCFQPTRLQLQHHLLLEELRCKQICTLLCFSAINV